MSASLIAGSVRGRSLSNRRMGRDGIRRLMQCDGLEEARTVLTASVYGRNLEPTMDPLEVEHEIGATALWHLRVLAGWLPPSGVGSIRPFMMWFELSNILAHAISLASGHDIGDGGLRYTLGRLTTAWPAVEGARSLDEIRQALASSDFGDPGGSSLAEVLAGAHLGWARALIDQCPQRPDWGLGYLALHLAAARFVDEATVDVETRSFPGIGSGWRDAGDLATFVRALPPSASWVFETIETPERVWRAERTWWERLAESGASMATEPPGDLATVVGAGAVLLADARLTQLALSVAIGPSTRTGLDDAFD